MFCDAVIAESTIYVAAPSGGTCMGYRLKKKRAEQRGEGRKEGYNKVGSSEIGGGGGVLCPKKI